MRPVNHAPRWIAVGFETLEQTLQAMVDVIVSEEAVALVDDVAKAEAIWSRACRRASQRVAEAACQNVLLAARRRDGKRQLKGDVSSLANIFANAGISPERRARSSAFRSRPYHDAGVSRFLFSTSDESDGWAQNKSRGWVYDLSGDDDS